jgi:hypothetical protein
MLNLNLALMFVELLEFCQSRKFATLRGLPAIPKVGSRIQFRLYTGRYEEGIVRAILNTDAGTKLRIQYGSSFATIEPDAIV